MSMGMEVSVFLAYAFGVLMVYILGRFLMVPLKCVMGFVVSSICGGIVILIVNLIGAAYGIFIPLNTITAAIIGVLGVPGLIMVTVFFY